MPPRTDTYVALLRGINVGGHAIMSMKDVVALFERLGLDHVRSYIASGNVIFETEMIHPRVLEDKIEKTLVAAFRDYDAKVIVLNKTEMQRIVRELPWKRINKALRYNVIFLRHDIDSKAILEGIEPKRGVETIKYAPGVLYWAAKRSDLAASSMAKLSRSATYKELTVRSVNTVKKLAALMT